MPVEVADWAPPLLWKYFSIISLKRKIDLFFPRGNYFGKIILIAEARPVTRRPTQCQTIRNRTIFLVRSVRICYCFDRANDINLAWGVSGTIAGKAGLSLFARL